MLNGLFMLLTLSALMAIASFLAGLLPLSLSLSQSQLRLISALGMGVLVGTSLIVIIPEGIETLYSANQISYSHTRRHLYEQALDVRWTSGLVGRPSDGFPLLRRDVDEANAGTTIAKPDIPEELEEDAREMPNDPPRTPTAPGEVGALREQGSTSRPDGSTQQPQEPKGARTPHAWVGVSLILGFILMYLIDTLPSLNPSPPPQRMNIYSLSDLSSTAPSSSSSQATPKASFSTTLGLVIHAAADGIALGASAAQPSLSFIIFIAIMVHKAPAAFGLTSVLMKQGLGKRQARAHLVAFSLAAPIGALCTWLLVRILGGGGESGPGADSMKFWTGVILLFSGGTFLYVAMHTMQDEAGDSSMEESLGNGYLDAPHTRDAGRQKSQKSIQLVMTTVVGMLLPLITQIGHAH